MPIKPKLLFMWSKSTQNIYQQFRIKQIGHDCEAKIANLLGIFVDEYLTWKYHIAHVDSKVSRSIFVLKQAKHVLHMHAGKYQ